MIEILTSPNHVVAIKLSGTLSGEDYYKVVVELEARLDRHERIGVLVDLVGLTDFTFEAGMKDLRYGLRNLWRLKRFPREAVITDKEWVRALARVGNPIIPHVEVRTFEPGEGELAMSWVSDILSP